MGAPLLLNAWPRSLLDAFSSPSPCFVDSDRNSGKVLSLDTINPNLREMEYAVRGAVPIRAGEISAEIAEAKAKGLANPYNFSAVLPCNIGNPQAVGQKPITFYRQVLSLVDSPSLLEYAKSHKRQLRQALPSDVIQRADELSQAIGGGTGAYSHSQGVEMIRKDVCSFIDERDNVDVPCRPEDLYLLNGASAGIQSILTAIITGPQDAVLTPIPQYPIYSAVIKLLGGRQIGYYLDEAGNWGLSLEELQRSYDDAVAQGLKPKALVLINPGNPTGQVLSSEQMQQAIRFCEENKLVLLADEVYQENVYAEGAEFISARRAYYEMGSDIELVSFHSTSKGIIGECGRRGGYMEVLGFDPEVVAQIYKLQSSQLCPNLDGQVMTDLMVRPPQKGEPSYALFEQERSGIFGGLRRKAKVLVERLNQIDGISSTVAAGAMYAFVSMELPAKAIEAAREQGMAPDLMYCLSLLESTGIITVQGSGFGQVDGTYHFRTTFLPPEDRLYEALDAFKAHHEAFMAKYA